MVVDDQQLENLSRMLDAVMMKHAEQFPRLRDAELHGSTIMRASEEPWRSVPLRVRFRIFEETMQAVFDSGARIYLEGINISRQIARGYPHVTPARELAFSHLFERINDCCHNSEPQIRVVADEHHTAEISRSNFNRYQIAGTYGYRSSRLTNIHPDISFVESHTSRALQASDMVTYLYNRVYTVSENDVRAHRQKHRMWQIVDGAARWPRGRARIWP